MKNRRDQPVNARCCRARSVIAMTNMAAMIRPDELERFVKGRISRTIH
jgi:hypothetical protein